MLTQLINPDSVAILLARLLLGFLFFFQGFDKVFSVGIKAEIDAMRPAYGKLGMPDFLIQLVAYFTSYIELIAPIFIIIGFFKYYALYLLGIDLFVVSFGMSILNPVWKMDLVFPRFALVLFLLVYPSSADLISLQHLLGR